MAKDLRHADVVAGTTSENDFEGTALHIVDGGAAGDIPVVQADETLLGKTPDEAVGAQIDTDIATHTADLDAHTKNIAEELRTGEYFYPSPFFTYGNRSITANVLYGVPVLVARAMTVDRIAIEVLTQGAGGTKARLGIYSVHSNLYPTTLLLDAGTVDVDSTGVKTIVINQALAKGWNFVALVSDGTPTIQGFASAYTPLGIRAADFNQDQACWYIAQAYGALPNPFTAAGAKDIGVAPLIALRLASLD